MLLSMQQQHGSRSRAAAAAGASGGREAKGAAHGDATPGGDAAGVVGDGLERDGLGAAHHGGAGDQDLTQGGRGGGWGWGEFQRSCLGLAALLDINRCVAEIGELHCLLILSMRCR